MAESDGAAQTRCEGAIDVVAAVIRRADGHVLLARRPEGKPAAGHWEFPGGKIEPGESAEQALARELYEELGITATAFRPWIGFEHAPGGRWVRLRFHRVTAWSGEPHGREGQRLAWVDPARPTVAPLLPANDRMLDALALPPVYAITNAAGLGVDAFLDRLDRALEGGVRLIQVRERGLAGLEGFAREVVRRAHLAGARVLINGDEALAERCGADGVHLPSAQLMAARRPPHADLWAASCHDAAELERAAEFGARFAVLSPVLPTASHPGVPGMGWHAFAERVRGCPLPVYALGGMRPEALDEATRHGAHGIALLSGIW